jgi:hypothetical protein
METILLRFRCFVVDLDKSNKNTAQMAEVSAYARQNKSRYKASPSLPALSGSQQYVAQLRHANVGFPGSSLVTPLIYGLERHACVFISVSCGLGDTIPMEVFLLSADRKQFL